MQFARMGSHALVERQLLIELSRRDSGGSRDERLLAEKHQCQVHDTGVHRAMAVFLCSDEAETIRARRFPLTADGPRSSNHHETHLYIVA